MIFSSRKACWHQYPAICFWCNNKLSEFTNKKRKRPPIDKTKIKSLDHLWPLTWFKRDGHVCKMGLHHEYKINPSANNLVMSCEMCNWERGRVLTMKTDKPEKVSIELIKLMMKWNNHHLDKGMPQFVIERFSFCFGPLTPL